MYAKYVIAIDDLSLISRWIGDVNNNKNEFKNGFFKKYWKTKDKKEKNITYLFSKHTSNEKYEERDRHEQRRNEWYPNQREYYDASKIIRIQKVWKSWHILGFILEMLCFQSEDMLWLELSKEILSVDCEHQ